jgi:hypothetical protein
VQLLAEAMALARSKLHLVGLESLELSALPAST